MSEDQLKRICIRFKEYFGEAFAERIERSLGGDFEKLVDVKTEDTLKRILQEIHRYYVMPLEMLLQISRYLDEVYGIRRASIFVLDDIEFNIHERMREMKNIVSYFYEMVDTLGMGDTFTRNAEDWWKG